MSLVTLGHLLCTLAVASPEVPPAEGTPNPDPVVATEAAEAPPETDLDRLDTATACLRRTQLPCARDAALRLLAVEPVDGAILRDGLIVLGQVESLLDHPDEAEAAFRRLSAAGSAWRPDRDADPRVIAAWVAARTQQTPPSPQAAATVAETFTPKAFFASVGAGVAFPVGSAADRYDAGLAAMIDLGWRWDLPGDPHDDRPLLGVVLSFGLANLGLTDTILAESGQATTLRATLVTAGLDLRIPFAPAWQAVFQAGAGYGAFGLGSASSGPALALLGSIGARWQLAEAFALRADFTPVLFIPFKGAVGTAGHPGFTLRAEASF